MFGGATKRDGMASAVDGPPILRCDRRAAAAVVRALPQRYPEVGSLSPVELQSLQVRWFAEHAEALSCQLDKPIDLGWPLPRSTSALTEQDEPTAVRLPLD